MRGMETGHIGEWDGNKMGRLTHLAQELVFCFYFTLKFKYLITVILPNEIGGV